MYYISASLVKDACRLITKFLPSLTPANLYSSSTTLGLLRDLLFSLTGFIISIALFIAICITLVFICLKIKVLSRFFREIFAGVGANTVYYIRYFRTDEGIKVLGAMLVFILILKPLTDISSSFQQDAELKKAELHNKMPEVKRNEENHTGIANNPNNNLSNIEAQLAIITENLKTLLNKKPESIEPTDLAHIQEAIASLQTDMAKQNSKIRNDLRNKPEMHDIRNGLDHVLGLNKDPNANIRSVLQEELGYSSGKFNDSLNKKTIQTIDAIFKDSNSSPRVAFRNDLESEFTLPKATTIREALSKDIKNNAQKAIADEIQNPGKTQDALIDHMKTAIKANTQDAVLAEPKFTDAVHSAIPINKLFEPISISSTKYTDCDPNDYKMHYYLWRRIIHPVKTGTSDILCLLQKRYLR